MHRAREEIPNAIAKKCKATRAGENTFFFFEASTPLLATKTSKIEFRGAKYMIGVTACEMEAQASKVEMPP
jgi:hypothetical protein